MEPIAKSAFCRLLPHKATLVNQPEMLITEEGGRADGQSTGLEEGKAHYSR